MSLVGASRSELLEWINTSFNLHYTKIEQCGNGAVYCQIFDAVYGDVPLSKVNFNATQSYQYLSNYKILQSGFSRHKITREVPVEKLMKFRLQDNLEFLQWMSKLWSEKNSADYDPVARRKSSGGNLNGGGPGTGRSGSSAAQRNSAITNTTRRLASGNTTPTTTRRASLTNRLSNPSSSSTINVKKQRPPVSGSNGLAGPGSRLSSSSRVRNNNNGIAGTTSSAAAATSRELLKVTEENKLLKQQVDESQQVQENLETERNFYFNKLREIEIICQNLNDKISSNETIDIGVNDLVQHVQEILYSTAEGFQVPDEQEEIIEDASMMDTSGVPPQQRSHGMNYADDETF